MLRRSQNVNSTQVLISSVVAALMLGGCPGSLSGNTKGGWEQGVPKQDAARQDDTGATTDLPVADLPATDFPPRKGMLEYSYTARGHTSSFDVAPNGAVSHLEGGDTLEPQQTPALTHDVLNQLEAFIAQASTGTVETKTTFGGSDHGRLVVFTRDGQEIVIRILRKSTTPGALQPDRVTFNDSEAGRQIQSLITTYVESKMPL